ncbi:hypothetical protein EW026_g5739 [Hermanssonia centrifuga]|uniref:DNA 3'-5' helicase n=1 Tax=Hermanssonia centrifuga TaxID=98765 RepID=A0A4S4KD60_9APHY|nr:hypothetical protein EW026_g5739 [Hermanssonia centrifuga]
MDTKQPEPTQWNLPTTSGGIDIPNIESIRSRCIETFGVRPCRWQAEFAQAILARTSDIILEVATGGGKTLAFWLPLLFRKSGIQIIVTALNVLGKQNVDSLSAAGISAISIDGNLSYTERAEVFKKIAKGEYRVIVISPEQLMKEDGHFDTLFKDRAFQDLIISIIFDEAHCIKTWGTFRPEYREVERLRHRLQKDIPFALASATLPTLIRQDISKVVRLRKEGLVCISRPTDRPNVHLVVRRIHHALSSYKDLGLVIPDCNTKPPKFLIFFDNIKHSVDATKYLWSLLSQENKPEDKIKWFNAGMSVEYKQGEIDKLRSGETWGLCTTDSFGMGMDISDIELIIQYKVTCSLCALWQRFGRGARDREKEATAIFFVEAKYLDEERAKKEARKVAKKAKQAGQSKGRKRGRKQEDVGDGPSMKRIARELVPSQSHPIMASSSTPATIQTRTDLASGPSQMKIAEDVKNESESEQESDASEEDEEDGLHRALYAQPTSQPAVNKTKRVELEPAMDDFINAGERKLKCRRRPVRWYFDNDKSESDHLLCDPTKTGGCSRCSLNTPTLCCDLHENSKATLTINHPPAIVDKQGAKVANRSPIEAFIHNHMDKDAYSEIQQWRVKKTIEQYGAGALDNYGPGIVLPIDTLERIVDCIHAMKISSSADLWRETKWSGIDTYGAEIMQIIEKLQLRRIQVTLTPLTTTQPLTRRTPQVPASLIADTDGTTIATIGTTAVDQKRSLRCGACFKLGHNRRNQHCENYGRVVPDKSRNPQARVGPQLNNNNAAPQPSFAIQPTMSVASGNPIDTMLDRPAYQRTFVNPALLITPVQYLRISGPSIHSAISTATSSIVTSSSSRPSPSTTAPPSFQRAC